MNRFPKYDYFSRSKLISVISLMQLNTRFLTFIIILLGTQAAVYAQQAPVFTHHTNTNMFVNPGFAGLGEGICLNGIVRQQWAGFEDADGNQVAPETFLITGDAPVKLLRGGLGGSIMQDKIGFYNDIGVNIGYAYHLDVGGANLGIGAAINFLNRTLDFSKFNPQTTGDPALLTGSQSDMLFDANVGLFWQVPDNYYIGISVTSLLQSRGKTLSDQSGASFVGDRTFYFVTGYEFRFAGIPAYEFTPALSIMTNAVATQFNFSGTVSYNKKFWGGVNYRFQESVGLLVGLSIKDFRFGYAYDINTLGYGVPGSHEISLGYCFKINADKGIRSYRNIRYL
jgi:type IX secretion system PorP/SprF family membrane protein